MVDVQLSVLAGQDLESGNTASGFSQLRWTVSFAEKKKQYLSLFANANLP